MDINSFIVRLDNTTKSILQLVKSLTSPQLAFKEDGKWNILEILEHICITDKIIMIVISRPSESTHTTEDIYGARKIKAMMDERDKKILSPESLRPKGIFSDVFVAEKAFLQQRDTLKNSLRAGDIIIDNRIHTHPFLGEMTIGDWLNFIIHHTERHIEQIKDTADASLRNTIKQ